MKKKKVILSFDYELFFGDVAGTVRKSIIEPTNRILEVLDEVNGKAVFFVDYLMLERFHKESEETKVQAYQIEEQLRDIVRRGSRIELHLHPHWVDAKYVNGKWDFSNFEHYCLNSLPQEVVTKMFVDGTKYLNRIAQEVDPSYNVTTFRAGGWAVLPFECMYEGFVKSGIYIDSSITAGRKIIGYTHEVDFTKSPKDVVYRYSKDIMKVDPNGPFYEVQIASYKCNLLEKILFKLYMKKYAYKYRVITDGTHTQAFRNKQLSAPRSFWEKVSSDNITYAIRGGAKPLLIFHTLFAKENVIVYMGHPKDMNQALIDNIRGISSVARFVEYNEIIKEYEQKNNIIHTK